jgi:hypothetical protein
MAGPPPYLFPSAPEPRATARLHRSLVGHGPPLAKTPPPQGDAGADLVYPKSALGLHFIVKTQMGHGVFFFFFFFFFPRQ